MAEQMKVPGTPPPGTTSGERIVVPGWRKIETRGPLYARDENGRIAKLPDPEPLKLPRPDVWIGRVYREETGGYAAVVVESRDGVEISRYEVLEDDGNLNPAWDAISRYVAGKWLMERYNK